MRLRRSRRYRNLKRRYDDNTPLPDDFEDEEDIEAVPVAPQRRAIDGLDERRSELDEVQVDLELGKPEEWVDLLDEDDDLHESPQDDHADAAALEAEDDDVEQELSIEDIPEDEDSSNELYVIQEEQEVEEEILQEAVAGGASVPVDLDSQFDMQAEAMGLTITGRHDVNEVADDAADEEVGSVEKEETLGSEALDAETQSEQDSADDLPEEPIDIELADDNFDDDHKEEAEDSAAPDAIESQALTELEQAAAEVEEWAEDELIIDSVNEEMQDESDETFAGGDEQIEEIESKRRIRGTNCRRRERAGEGYR